MDEEVRHLFHEVAGMAPGERQRALAEAHIAPEIRAELESLLSFDSADGLNLSACVAGAANELLCAAAGLELAPCGRFPVPVDPQLETRTLQGAPLHERRREATPEVLGNKRFLVGRLLGSGGFGWVYEAWDQDACAKVALKVFRPGNADLLYGFKREFRALAELRHPGLVRFFEMFSEGHDWFFTMELIHGTDLLGHIRILDPGPTRWTKIRSILLQLVIALDALHSAGKIHRDIKPGNVMVSVQGRVVVLDFGLVHERSAANPGQSIFLGAGTPVYMPPEQATKRVVTSSADWYSLGVVLFEILTGQLPFNGSPWEIMARKLTESAPRVMQLNPQAPLDLARICDRLLEREPSLRPSADEIISVFGGETACAAGVWPEPHESFVGRKREIELLLRCLREGARDGAMLVNLRGNSGMGKSALLEKFLQEAAQHHPDVLTLSGRCRENENVPFKALDEIVDSIGRLLAVMTADELRALTPRNAHLLARVFPVLSRTFQADPTGGSDGESADHAAVRRRAFKALQELFEHLAGGKPLLLIIDDLQWGDLDSAAFLAQLVQTYSEGLLIVCSFRTEDEAESAFLREFRERITKLDSSRRLTIELEPLSRGEVSEMIQNLLGTKEVPIAQPIAEETGGNPLLIDQLLRHGMAESRASSCSALHLADVISHRISKLPDGARVLLETVALAGQPIRAAIVQAAVAVQISDAVALRTLIDERLVRVRKLDGVREVETYHDTIREQCLRALSAEICKARSRALAEALETASADAASLAKHFLAAGLNEKAFSYSIEAGDHAADALAFNRAIQHYRTAIAISGANTAGLHEARRRLADVLVHAGHGTEAAGIFLNLSAYADAHERVALQRRAAEQFLRAGHVDEGIAILRDMAGSYGVRIRSTKSGIISSFLIQRARLRMRGLCFKARGENDVPKQELERLDAYWGLASGFSMVDPFRGAEFQARFLLHSLRAGEPRRIALGLSLEAAHNAVSGGDSNRVRGLVNQAVEFSERLGDPHCMGTAYTMRAAAAWLRGDWIASVSSGEAAERILQSKCTGVAWELDTARVFLMGSLVWCGRLADHSARLPQYLQDAQDRGDLYGMATLALLTYAFYQDLAADRALDSGSSADVLQMWSRRGFHLQHYWAMFAEAERLLYQGRGGESYELIRARRKDVSGSMLLRVQTIRIFHEFLQARCALAAMNNGAAPAKLLKEARRHVRRLQRQHMRWADGIALLALAGIRAFEGRTQETEQLLHSAETVLTEVGMALYAHAAQYRRGTLDKGAIRSELLVDAQAFMSGQGIVNIPRMMDVFAPMPRNLA